jgi:PKD repeat protein
MSIKRTCTILAAAAALGLVPAASAAPPAGDDFAAATTISSLPFSETVDLGQATSAPDDPQICSFTYETVWYAFTAPADAVLRADTSGSGFFGANLTVFRQTGFGPGGLSYVACGSFSSPVTFNVQGGQTYYIEAGTPFNGGGMLQMNLQEIPPPANDAFANAAPIGATPFTTSLDLTAATVEQGEPTPACGYGPTAKSAWFAFTAPAAGSYTLSAPSGIAAQVAVYTGSSLASLSPLGCRAFAPLTFHADAGTTYYLQVGTIGGNNGAVTVTFDVAPPPVAQFATTLSDPSVFDTVQFFDTSGDPAGVGINAWSYDFGDGTSATGQSVQHRYAADGDYTVTHTVTTADGRTATNTLVLRVRTHDVSISKVTVPQAASAGQTRQISVSVSDTHYPETVQVQLLKGAPGGNWTTVGVLTQSVVPGGGHGTDFAFSYTFTSDDAGAGKVSFRAVATIQGARDSYPGDNDVTALPTKVK